MGERHKVRNIQFRIFQNHQDKYADVLRGRPIWLAFARSRETVGDESVFLGAYEGDSAALTGHVGGVAEWMFDKRLSPLLEEFRGRLVIDWTGGAINWVIAPTNDFPYINVVSEHNSVGIAPPPNRKWAEQDIGFPSSPSPLRPLNSATLSPFEGDVTSPDATAAWERTRIGPTCTSDSSRTSRRRLQIKLRSARRRTDGAHRHRRRQHHLRRGQVDHRGRRRFRAIHRPRSGRGRTPGR